MTPTNTRGVQCRRPIGTEERHRAAEPAAAIGEPRLIRTASGVEAQLVLVPDGGPETLRRWSRALALVTEPTHGLDVDPSEHAETES
jgi:hypothetical protein